MADAPRLQTSALAGPTSKEVAATTSPARGQEMRSFLQSRLLQKNRAPQLVHSWDFWHDRQERQLSNANTIVQTGNYEERLEVLANVDDVRKFWNVFNNFDISRLALRDSIHLFHKGVKPVWEDPRNTRGGSWTFRVPKAQAEDFWKEICMMAVGEQLQQAVESQRTTFRDDICGISLAVRYTSMLVQIWNRDGEHQQGIDNILETVSEGLSDELRPKEGGFYYKKHSEHAGFNAASSHPPQVPPGLSSNRTAKGVAGEQPMQSMDAIATDRSSV